MLYTLTALILRIFSNPFSNIFQKKFIGDGFGAFYLNFVTYLGLTILCLPIFIQTNWLNCSEKMWICAIFGGFCGALGNSFLVKALAKGELSVLGPINSYKSVVAMFFGIIFLREPVSIVGIFAIWLIIFGSYFIFETTDEHFSLKLFKRVDIRYRFLALFFTALEAVMIKNVILDSSVMISFALWCFFGMVFSFIFIFIMGEKMVLPPLNNLFQLGVIILSVGIMQVSTNYVFSHMNVSYALALFQLSTLLSVIFGYKIFMERNILQKLLGASIMMLGAMIIVVA